MQTLESTLVTDQQWRMGTANWQDSTNECYSCPLR